jgi:hypothetical protein
MTKTAKTVQDTISDLREFKAEYWANREAGWRGQGEYPNTVGKAVVEGTGVNRGMIRAQVREDRRKRKAAAKS